MSIISIKQQFRMYGSLGALKGLFIVVGAILTLAFLFHAQITVRDLEQNQRELVQALGVYFITQSASEEVTDGSELSMLIDQIQQMNFPIVVTDERGNPLVWKEVGIPNEPDDPMVVAEVRLLITEMDAETVPVRLQVPGLRMLLHYQYTPAVRRMRWLPFVEIGLAGLFVFLSLFIYRNIKQLEQRNIWIGMAKETAHQFGTPLSALTGWLELVRMEVNPEGAERRGKQRKIDDIIDEMNGDITRLNKIASRFSQIGSVPDLHRQDIRSIIADSVDYFQKRVPKRARSLDIQASYDPEHPLFVDGNRELLEWVIENLLKNALDAVDSSKGLIQVSARSNTNNQSISVTVQDNGKGVPHGAHRQVFDPGFTTKQRGWGLGLSLAKRIIEEYHRGRLTLLESNPGEGTTFEIVLPVSSGWETYEAANRETTS